MDSRRLRRSWIFIYHIIKKREIRNLPKEAEALGVSLRTLQRDIKDLIAAGFPLEHGKGWVKLKANLELPPELYASERDRIVMLNLLSLGESFFKETAEKSLKNLKRAILKSFPDSKLEHLEASNYYIFHNPKVEKIKYCVLNSLEKSMVRKLCVYIEYNHPTKGNQAFPFEPYRFLFSKGHWYVLGKNKELKATLLYRVSRISKVHLSKTSFKMPSDEEIKNIVSGIWETHCGNRIYEIKVKFNPEVASKIAETVRHRSQKIEYLKDGSLIMTVHISGYKEFMWWVLSWGKNAEIISPEWIRKKVTEELKFTLENYEK